MHDDKHSKPSRLQAFGRRARAASWAAVAARMLVGGLFVFSGISKLLLPHGEVMALVKQYQVVPDFLVSPIAAGLPWLELASGTALCIGFLTTPVAWLVGAQLVGFSLLMVVVLIAQIPIEDCGCFGNLGIRETPLHVLIRDLVLLGMLASVLVRRQDAWSIDAWAGTAGQTSSANPEGVNER